MTWSKTRRTGVVIVALCTLSVANAFGAHPLAVTRAHAQEEISAEAIAMSLRKRKTRFAGADAAAAKRDIEDLKRIRKVRGWSLHDRVRLAKVSSDLAQIDLIVHFGFDSADLSPQAEMVLDKLGAALARDEFKNRTFVLAGHTDAKGTAEYNRSLSERRADAVKTYLARRFSVAESNLMTVGYGYERLKSPQDPLGDENRRVQVINFN